MNSSGDDRKEERTYIAIDLKSFYASVECVELGLDPLNTHLVVADESRTAKTICLAVSPSLKAYGIPGRARLFQVIQRIREVNEERKRHVRGHELTGSSYYADELQAHPEYAVDYLVARPRMAYYIKHSTEIYDVYLQYIAPEDIYVYSIDEVFIDATAYLSTYQMTARELAGTLVRAVYEKTGITATAGIGTNMYLCKVAMDVVAKHVDPDEYGVRIASLDEISYRKLLWDHKPITDFWRVGPGYARKLKQYGMETMGDVARCSIGKETDYHNEELLYRLFGVNAELLIDHAWGWEPCTMEQIKSYKPRKNGFCSGQVLSCPYDVEKARLVVKEMVDGACLDLVDKGMVTDHVTLTIGYDIECLTNPEIRKLYKGPVTIDRHGRRIPKHTHGTIHLERKTSSSRLMTGKVLDFYDREVNPNLLIRRITLYVDDVVKEEELTMQASYEQLDFFTDYKALEAERKKKEEALQKERKLQEAMLSVKKRFGKNAMLKGMSLTEGATARQQNEKIGGHHS